MNLVIIHLSLEEQLVLAFVNILIIFLVIFPGLDFSWYLMFIQRFALISLVRS